MDSRHRQAELLRLDTGYAGCGCTDCQELYTEIDLTVYGGRVFRSPDGAIAVKEDKAKVAKLYGDKWIGADQICLIQGQGYAVRPDGRTLFMGADDEILRILETQAIPAFVRPVQRAEYERIFKIMEELNNESRRNTVELQSNRKFRNIKARYQRNRPAKGTKHRAKYVKRVKA